MKKLLTFLLIACFIFVTGCARLSKEDISGIRTVGIINNFPDSPNYTHIGTTIFTNQEGSIPDNTVKDVVTSEAKRQLKRAGLDGIKVIQPGDASDNIDLLVTLVPRELYGVVNTNGYGVYQRSLFVVGSRVYTYAALNVMLNYKGKDMCMACYGQSVTRLSNDELPKQWNELGAARQKTIMRSMANDIKEAVKTAFERSDLLDTGEETQQDSDF